MKGAADDDARHALAKFAFQCRIRKGLSQEGMAALGGISTGHISKIEAGKVPVTEKTLRLLIKILDAPPEQAWELFRAAGGNVQRSKTRSGEPAVEADVIFDRGFRKLQEGLRMTIMRGRQESFTEFVNIEFTRTGVRNYNEPWLHLLEKPEEKIGDRGYIALFGCYVENVETDFGGYTSQIRFPEHAAAPGRLHQLAFMRRELSYPSQIITRIPIIPWIQLYSYLEVAFLDDLPRTISLSKGNKKGEQSTSYGAIEVLPLIRFDIHNTESPGRFAYELSW